VYQITLQFAFFRAVKLSNRSLMLDASTSAEATAGTAPTFIEAFWRFYLL
jgi:hypothetical protein